MPGAISRHALFSAGYLFRIPLHPLFQKRQRSGHEKDRPRDPVPFRQPAGGPVDLQDPPEKRSHRPRRDPSIRQFHAPLGNGTGAPGGGQKKGRECTAEQRYREGIQHEIRVHAEAEVLIYGTDEAADDGEDQIDLCPFQVFCGIRFMSRCIQYRSRSFPSRNFPMWWDG